MTPSHDHTPSVSAEEQVVRAASGLWPIYEFRPIAGRINSFGDVRRFVDDYWIPDDGEYGVAFARDNCVLYFEPPYQKNIIWSGLTSHWRSTCSEHPRGNPWHYMLREGETCWGGDWGRDRHPNYSVGQRAMSSICSQYGCANGRSVEMKADDPHIAAGLLRRQDTREIVSFPERFICTYCGDGWEASRKATQ